MRQLLIVDLICFIFHRCPLFVQLLRDFFLNIIFLLPSVAPLRSPLPPPSPPTSRRYEKLNEQVGGAAGTKNPSASAVARSCWELVDSARRLCSHGDGVSLSADAARLLAERLVSARVMFRFRPLLHFTVTVCYSLLLHAS